MSLEVIDSKIQETDITFIKKAKCPSLSGRSELSYSIGKTTKGEIFICVERNSGAGKFSNGRVSLKKILGYIDNKEPFGWSVLLPLFQHQSVNTVGFIGAVLLQEGVVETVKEGRRSSYRYTGKSIKTTKHTKPTKPARRKTA